MGEFNFMARFLIITGILLVLVGVLLFLVGKIPYIGRLPGDIYIKKGNFSFYFPLVTCILLSILLTLIANLFFRR
ncbi:conserved hypothetical protein [Thermosulfidibacter takaii ABI70S6]|uniref:DUF2905 domain-containing protein n=1 Tax=Thermosulfidibacter takaii (strain DSM 17441 / JCM 13301 / NBRC 103674 / ABI70S6) TaxID=1298851 RepID=A0A0S3QT80_THET7|nr:DUF2905 domain-containing protein [Thermosulfidibacter takaii]BAT71534.1 conserved hypothetical protein [Thermosulfidibacter takaii ABI70S6]